MKLYYAPGTCALSVWISLEWAGADYEVEQVKLGSDEYKKINPLGAVPALDTGNEKIKTQANAILQYVADLYPDVKPIDRTTINSWEDEEFNEAVKSTGRKKLIMTALWTEACLSFPALDVVKEGYDVYAVVDAVGGTSKTAHETTLRRMEQAGVKLISWVQLACELQRDWNREETAEEFANILFGK